MRVTTRGSDGEAAIPALDRHPRSSRRRPANARWPARRAFRSTPSLHARTVLRSQVRPATGRPSDSIGRLPGYAFVTFSEPRPDIIRSARPAMRLGMSVLRTRSRSAGCTEAPSRASPPRIGFRQMASTAGRSSRCSAISASPSSDILLPSSSWSGQVNSSTIQGRSKSSLPSWISQPRPAVNGRAGKGPSPTVRRSMSAIPSPLAMKTRSAAMIPWSVRTPWTLPLRVDIWATRAPVLIVAPASRAASAKACVAPIGSSVHARSTKYPPATLKPNLGWSCARSFPETASIPTPAAL